MMIIQFKETEKLDLLNGIGFYPLKAEKNLVFI